MSHLTTSANSNTDAGAPGATGTSPGQDIGTDEVQDQTNTHKESKHSHGHADKSTKPEKSETTKDTHPEEGHLKGDSKDLLDTPSKVIAGTKTPSGAPGSTGASPMEPFGGDESRDDSPRVHDHHKHHDQSHKEESHSSGKTSSSNNNISSESKPSMSSKLSTKRKSAEDGESNPGVTASTKTPAGAVGPTGTAPMEPIGSDESRDDSPKEHHHHKHDSHSHSSETKSSGAESEGTSITNNKALPVPIEISERSSSDSKDTSSGANKTNGGFDGPNASFTSEIGSKEDPGRVAEAKMYARNAQHGDVGSMGVKQDSVTGDNQYEALNREEAA